MSARAKIVRNGGSQAVRLPKAYRFDDDQDEVIVRRVGRQIILEPADEWPPAFLATLGAWNDDIPRPRAADLRKDEAALRAMKHLLDTLVSNDVRHFAKVPGLSLENWYLTEAHRPQQPTPD